MLRLTDAKNENKLSLTDEQLISNAKTWYETQQKNRVSKISIAGRESKLISGIWGWGNIQVIKASFKPILTTHHATMQVDYQLEYDIIIPAVTNRLFEGEEKTTALTWSPYF